MSFPPLAQNIFCDISTMVVVLCESMVKASLFAKQMTEIKEEARWVVNAQGTGAIVHAVQVGYAECACGC